MAAKESPALEMPEGQSHPFPATVCIVAGIAHGLCQNFVDDQGHLARLERQHQAEIWGRHEKTFVLATVRRKAIATETLERQSLHGRALGLIGGCLSSAVGLSPGWTSPWRLLRLCDR